MSEEAVRRFLGLTVNEVSLVGNPANEEDQWLVAKSQGGSEEAMAGEKSGGDGGVESVTVKATGGADAAVLKEVGGIVDTIVKAAQAGVFSGAAPATTDSAVEKGMTLKAVFKSLGMDDAAVAKAAETLKASGVDIDKAMPPALAAALEAKEPKEGKGAKSGAAKTKKVDDVEEEDETAKAKSMTAKRVAMLQQAKAAIDALAGAFDPPSDRVPGNLPAGTSPSSSAITSTTKSADSPPAFDMAAFGATLESAVTKALAPVTKEVADLKAELAEVKKARPASGSLEGEGGTDTKVEKGGGSLWKGLL